MTSIAARPPSLVQNALGGGGGGGRLTREELIRRGQTGEGGGGPWWFIPVAMQALAQQPGDGVVRFLLATNFAKLMLVSAARQQLDLLPAEMAGEAAAVQLRGVLGQVTEARLGIEALEEIVRGNVEALCANGGSKGVGSELRGRIGEWRAGAAAWAWFRTRDGNVVRLARRVEGGQEVLADASRPASWRGLCDAAGGVARIELPHVAGAGHGSSARPALGTGGQATSGTGHGSQSRPVATGAVQPYTLEGIDPPWLLRRVYDRTPARADGYRVRINVLQSDAIEFLDGLAQADLRDVLKDDRVRVWLGAEAGARFAAELKTPARQDTQILGPALTLSTTRTRLSPTPEEAIGAAARLQQAEAIRLGAAAKAVYAGRDRAWWVGRMGESAQRTAQSSSRSDGATERRSDEGKEEGAPLRVLIPTCRYSTYIRHASADLCEAMNGLKDDRGGAVVEARVLIEPDDCSQFSTLAYLRAFAEFKPDLVVLINYTRGHMNGLGAGASCGGGGGGGVMPEGVPWVTWVQDSMPHQYTGASGRASGELDFLVGNLREELFRQFGYPRERALNFPIVASGRKFDVRREIASDLTKKHTCELAYVSHHSETPRMMHERKRREGGDNPQLTAAIDRVWAGIGAIAENPIADGPLFTRLRALTDAAISEVTGLAPDPQGAAQVLHAYTMPMADRMLRHQTVRWGVEMARKRGWRLHLYGRGWETVPEFAEFAKGELPHDEELRASYACAATHLHVSAHSVIHQRLLECVLSGGLPLARLQDDDLSMLRHWAGVAASRRAADEQKGPEVCDPWVKHKLGHRMLGYPVADHPEAMKLVALAQRMGVPLGGAGRDGYVWVNSAHVAGAGGTKGAAAVEREAEVLPRERNLFWLLGDPSETMFVSAAQLEERVGRAVEDGVWRARTVARLGARVRENLTHEAFAKRLIGFVGERLGS